MVRSGQRYFYLADAQHSTTALTTLTAATAATYTYTAFGVPTATGTLANPFTYTGQFYEPKAGLLLFPLRAYDPTLGRFLSEDPQPSLNPYPMSPTTRPTSSTRPARRLSSTGNLFKPSKKLSRSRSPLASSALHRAECIVGVATALLLGSLATGTPQPVAIFYRDIRDVCL